MTGSAGTARRPSTVADAPERAPVFFDGAVEVIDEPFPDPPAVHCAAALGDDEYTTSLLAAGPPEDDAAAGARRGPSGPACREFLTHVKSNRR